MINVLIGQLEEIGLVFAKFNIVANKIDFYYKSNSRADLVNEQSLD